MAQASRTIWVPNSPESLLKLASRYCLKHKEVFTEQLPCGSLKLLDDGLYLPREICESLFQICHEEHINIDDKFTNIFADSQNSKLRQLTVSDSSVTDNGMRCLLAHNLRKISITNCVHLTTRTFEFINEYSDNLISLSVDNTSQIFPDCFSTANPDSEDEFEDEYQGMMGMNNNYDKRPFIKMPTLKNLCIKDFYAVQGRNYFDTLCKALPNLSHLDLSGLMSQGPQDLKFLLNCPHLVSLILHNVDEVTAALNTLCQMKKVEHLDISQFEELNGDFEQPSEYLEQLILNLPSLKSLDISGTNLAANYSNLGGRLDGTQCDIPGLARRIENPLEFLGLYKTHPEAAQRRHIPARVVSGSFSEEQIIVAGRRYYDRPRILENVLTDLMMMIRQENCKKLEEVVDITVLAMGRYCKEKKVQRYASAILYYLLPLLIQNKSEDFNISVKRRMMGVLLDSMMEHKKDTILMRNCCAVLWQFQVPQDLLCLYERVLEILLYIGEHYISGSVEESHTQRSALILIDRLVCHVGVEQKRIMGVKVIDGMLRIVRNKLDRRLCDEVMKTAWSAMLNITDETPANSERFLDMQGMELFLQCKETFPKRLDLLSYMMGLLGNVAEVKQCRKRLMTSAFVEVFSFLLDSQTDGMEASINAAEVLCHMASDGPAAWTVSCPPRDYVLEGLVRAVDTWDINTDRKINYNTLSPILGLLSVTHTRECQLWATWAVANLTKFDEPKYCPLVEQEGGLQQIREIVVDIVSGGMTSNNNVNEKLVNLGQRVIISVETWRKNSEYSLLSN